MTPLALLVMLLLLGIAVWIFTTLQITGTEQRVAGLLQLTTSYPTSATPSQIAASLQGRLSRDQMIADAIGWGVQVVLWTLTLSPDGALVLVHLKHTDVPAIYLHRQAALLGKLRALLLILLIGMDILTDFLYAVQGHTVLVWDGWYPSIPSSAAAGTLLVGLLYPAVLLFINVYGVKYLFALASALFQKIRATATVS
jgi:hypothetical protein